MTEREPRTGSEPPPHRDPSSEADLERLVEELEELEELVDHPAEREQVRRAIHTAHRVPGVHAVENGIKRYTTRDMAEAFVGSILLSLPLLVEDGVFEIAEHFVEFAVAGVPVFLIANVLFIGLFTTALLYWTDIRDVGVTDPLFGFVPRRLVGVLGISLLTATGLMIMWGRIFEGEPTTAEAFGRITVIWTAGAFGAALGDILPGESEGIDVTREGLDRIRDDGR
ncbi:hypothetical protein C491_20437 [Natronococcus amylolyticus DSM 10524]|uniref:DUF2391 domain-containing protein n=1 Tax=Natronococcus amylolyticus DSM 10524 TaxID=1227497 RepID=L9WWT8_9EURY|nr:hypothetical protein [Natronococcus amylolyticus]ELY53882.1 hypothetical protein C491_20437 [Natronococcus amylolyticus DSM 10524]